MPWKQALHCTPSPQQLLPAPWLFQELSVLLTPSIAPTAAVVLHATGTTAQDSPLKITCQGVHKTVGHSKRTCFISNIMWIKVASQTHWIAFNLSLLQMISLSSLKVSWNKTIKNCVITSRGKERQPLQRAIHYVLGGSMWTKYIVYI